MYWMLDRNSVKSLGSWNLNDGNDGLTQENRSHAFEWAKAVNERKRLLATNGDQITRSL